MTNSSRGVVKKKFGITKRLLGQYLTKSATVNVSTVANRSCSHFPEELSDEVKSQLKSQSFWRRNFNSYLETQKFFAVTFMVTSKHECVFSYSKNNTLVCKVKDSLTHMPFSCMSL